MKLKYLLITALAVMPQLLRAQKKPIGVAQTTLARPKLVVGIVVDQMRWDYLYRYYDRYQAGGFKRMLNEGFTCENTNIDYLPTETAPGHSCIYTGSVPAIHGIAANNFYDQQTGRYWYCTEDTTVQSVGTSSKAGVMSPRNLLASTITDELRLATNFHSKVIGIALKDRASILPAGHTPNGAYWFDDASGNFITSSYYMTDLPAWVKQFNSKKLPESYLSKTWNTLYPIDTYTQSTADNMLFEVVSRGDNAPVFPHSFTAHTDYGTIRATPFGNTLTADFAKAAIDAEHLGSNTATDFLAISFSSTDYVGHQYGPNSIEAEDVYLRLDNELSSLFTYLDAKVGRGNYVAFLTADHGAAHNATFALSHNLPAGLWDGTAAARELNKMLEDKYKIKQAILSVENYQVNFNNREITKSNVSTYAIKQDCINWLAMQPGVMYAVDMQNVQAASIPAELREHIVNGYNAAHSGAIQVILKPGWYAGRSKSGASHGVSAPYDTHIPFVLMGWGIQHGSLVRPTHMTDITATVAALLHIQAPSGSIGIPVQEALKK
ncbi:alkaline phosphatase family protein [Mucilaginibacter robiniae]|uniref:glycerophosphocholine cholinephosphodiesterase n=1 Tax=Mucilaginibacter robiniae TaxID=2728022 RepID=A0A7L5E0Z4_9SPHI|nr:alkaline phosphatase PafA [Mucilaginibacter robiniae]QJD96701.1 alkaline phosphatase family protein [Mucilaginibacter robiniae]